MKGARKQQAGAALFMALIILLVVSIMGVAAMRTSSMASRIAMGTQLDAMVFEAAESAIVESMIFITEANASDDPEVFELIVGLFNGESLVWCYPSSGVRIARSCKDAEVMDARGALLSEGRVRSVGFSPASGNQISMSGGMNTIIGDFQLAIQGNGHLPGYGLTNRHVQNALRRGMIPAQEIE